MAAVKTIGLPEALVKAILHRARLKNVDESTAIRQLLAMGVKDYVVKLYQEGKITLNEAADLANLTVRETIDLLYDRGLKGNVRVDQQKKVINFITQS